MLPLDSLLHRLESAGFRISPADRLRVVQLLEAMGNECLENPQKLRLLLAPILARSAAEQAKFYEVFDSWMPKPIVGVTPSHPDNKRLRWLLAAGLVVAILLVAGYFKYCDSSTNNKVIQGPVQSGVVDTLKTKPDPNEGKTPLKEEKEILKPELPVKKLLLAKEKELPRPAWPAWSLLGFLTLASAWMWWKWTRRSRPLPPEAKPLQGPAGIIQGEIADAPPYTIPFRGQEAYIRTGREQYRLADAMRQRQQGEHPYMDVPASVQATLDKGGFPTLRFRMRRQPADYLCIMEEKHRQSHLARLFKFFTEHIRGQDVALEIFQASGTLDRFWNARHPGGLTLEQLQRLYPAHRLIVFGDAHALLDISASGAARVRPEVGAAFRRWRQRVLFTPNAPITWTFEEKALYDLFVLFPATLQGMNDAAHHIEASVGVTADDEAPPSFARWREQAQQRGQSVQGGEDHRYTRWRDASDHEEYLAGRPDLLLWLRALAVYPVPTWEITLAIGQSLEKQGVTVRPDDLLILSRIGWLQNGRMPAGLREEFMEDLPPEAETGARQAVIAALEEARAEAGNGFAGIELGVNVAIQEFALTPHDPEKQEVMRLLFEAGRVNKAQEQVADLALAKTSEVLKTYEVSERPSAREFVQKAAEETPEAEPPKRPFFTRHFWIAIGLTLCAVGFGLLMYLLWFYTSWFPQEEKDRKWAQRNLFDWQVQADSATIWNNRGVQVWNEQQDTVTAIRWFNDAVNEGSTPPSEEFLKAAEKIANGSSDISAVTDSRLRNSLIDSLLVPLASGWQVALLNQERLYYNLAVSFLNAQFAQLPLPPENLRAYRELPEKYFGPGYAPGGIDSCIYFLYGIDNTGLKNDALHALGLAHLYRFRRDSAVACYERLMKQDSTYFINLRSPLPNLETLLGKLTNRVISVETGTDAGGKLQGRIYFQLKDNPRAPIQLQAELLDKNGKVLAQTTVPQRGAAKGLNQNTFTLPSSADMPAFVADSLRVKVLSSGSVLARWTSVNKFVWKGPDQTPEPDRGEKPYLSLYFDNNQPDGRSLQTSTNLDYQTTYINFIRKKEEYKNGYAKELSGSAKQAALASMDNFFEQEVRGGWERFIGFSEELYTMLEQGDTVMMELHGYGSESNGRQYDEALTSRRVSSVVNHFKRFDGGVFLRYISNGQLLITGSSFGKSKKSLNPGVYSLDAARKRKVELFYTKKTKTIAGTATGDGPAPDTDGDGVPDAQDKCPNEKGDPANGGCPLPDADQDGIPDGEDICPRDKGDLANGGCPVRIPFDPKIIAQIQANMIPIQGGTFTMGSEDKDEGSSECPHQVTVKSFQMSKYEVTEAQWRAVMGEHPLYYSTCDDCPVVNIIWNDAQKFLNKLNDLTGRNYRLPTEAEWEYAAKGGQAGLKYNYKYAGSDNPEEVAWFGNWRGDVQPVGRKKPNQLGLFDMSGNVSEWCQDNYQSYPCSKWSDVSEYKVQRGGSFDSGLDDCRTSARGSGMPDDGYEPRVGFRIAISSNSDK